jgi:cell division initiation protein
VDSFLDRVVHVVDELAKESAKLQDQVERLEHDLSRYRDVEEALKQTMVFAQKNAQELKYNVEKEAEVILQEAHAQAGQVAREAVQKAEQVVADAERRASDLLRNAHQQVESSQAEAHRRVDQLLREYQQLERQTKVFRAKFRSFLEAQLELLEDKEYGVGREVQTMQTTIAEQGENEDGEEEENWDDENGHQSSEVGSQAG